MRKKCFYETTQNALVKGFIDERGIVEGENTTS